MNDENASPLWLLFTHLTLLSMMAIGSGVIVLIPDIHRYVVDTHHWMTREQFTVSFTLAQAAPGPNLLFVTLIGWHVAGVIGALAATLAVLVPPSILTVAIMRMTHQRQAHWDEAKSHRRKRIGLAIRNGLAPVSVGLLIATCWLMIRNADHDWRSGVITAITIAIALKSRINPLWMIGAGAVAGVAGLV